MWFTALLSTLTGLGGVFNNITNRIADVKIKQEQAKTDKERMEYDQQEHELEARKAILVAEAGNRIAGAVNAGFRALLAIPVLAILWKTFIWDKVLGSFYHCAGPGSNVLEYCATFRTDPLSKEQAGVIVAVIAFYFAYDLWAKSRK